MPDLMAGKGLARLEFICEGGGTFVKIVFWYVLTFLCLVCLSNFDIFVFSLMFTYFCPYLAPINIPVTFKHLLFLDVSTFYDNLHKYARFMYIGLM